jgi:hypothetical protein
MTKKVLFLSFFLSFFFWHVRLCSVTLGLVTQVDVLHSLESIFIYFVGFCVMYCVGGGLGDLLRLIQSGLLLVDQR